MLADLMHLMKMTVELKKGLVLKRKSYLENQDL